MIKARIENRILLGIDEENVKRLKEGKPILVKGKYLAIEYDIIIAYGKTLDQISKDFNLPKVN